MASIITVALAAAIFLLMIFRPPAAWLFIPLGMAYFALLVWGAANISSNFYLEAFNRGNTHEKTIALTFDDGPDETLTPKILDILKKHQAAATFFFIGEKAEKNPALLRRISMEGHTPGIHAYRHGFFFDLMTRKKMERDLEMTSRTIERITGTKPSLFRPPYGVTNPTVAHAAKKLGLRVIGWSVRSLDTGMKDPERLVERIMQRLQPGAVVLLHDTQDVTLSALESLLVKMKKEGYRIVRLGELFTI